MALVSQRYTYDTLCQTSHHKAHPPTLRPPTRSHPKSINRGNPPPPQRTTTEDSEQPRREEQTTDGLLGKCTNERRKQVTWAEDGIVPAKPNKIETPRIPETSDPNLGLARPEQSTPRKVDKPITIEQATPMSNTPIVIVSTAPKPIWPDNLISTITATARLPSRQLGPHPFTFELTLEAAHKHFCILRRLGSLETALQQGDKDTVLTYGSEFRPTSQLEPILYLHPNWTAFKQLLERGSDWPIDDITEEERRADVQEALELGNHKGAVNNYALLWSLVEVDVIHRYSLPLPLEKIHLLPGVLIAPMNIVEQDTIDEHGNTVPKFRLTHNQSFKFTGSKTSLNSCLRKEDLHPCHFGWVIRCLINWIVAAPQLTNFGNKSRLQVRLPPAPPSPQDRRPILHPAPRGQDSSNGPPPDLWRSPLPLRMEHHI